VSRQLIAVAGLGIALAACSVSVNQTKPTADNRTQAEVEATSVRRTAVAEVQRIIANNPAPTSTPDATPVPRPSCQNAIWWHEARLHIGEVRTIQGTVIAMRSAPSGATMLEIGQPYPDPLTLAVVLPPSSAANLQAKSVCVAGRVTIVEGRPTIQVREPSAVAVLD
jgi:hypothetical protein